MSPTQGAGPSGQQSGPARPGSPKSDQSGLEKALLVASGIVQPVAEVLSQLTGTMVLLDAAEATRARARDFAGGLDGWYWAIPVELTGIYSGSACILVSQGLLTMQNGPARGDETAASFASMTDEYLARAGEKLASAWGGPVSLDRLGLRRTDPETAPQVLSESLGTGDLVAVRFPTRATEESVSHSFPGDRRGREGEVLVVLGGGLVRELGVRELGELGKECQSLSSGEPVARVSEETDAPASAPEPAAREPDDLAPTRLTPSETTQTAEVNHTAEKSVSDSFQGEPTARLAYSAEAASAAKAGSSPKSGPRRPDNVVDPTGPRRPDNVVDPTGPRRTPEELLARVRGLKVSVSADVGRKTMTLGELAGLRPGAVIDLAKSVTEPLELRIGRSSSVTRLLASGDAVTLPGGFGFRVRYLGVR